MASSSSSSWLPAFAGGKPAPPPDDLEAGEALYPGISPTDNMLRLQFVNKVFSIVGCQLLLTAAVAAALLAHPSAQRALAASAGWQIFLLLGSVLGLIPLHAVRDRHPLNLFALAAWTALFSVSAGLACTFAAPALVLQAVCLTAAAVAGLTAYTFWATRKGKEFTFLGPALFSGLWVLLVWGFIQAFFPLGPVGQTVYALLGAGVFSAYIVYDVHLLATRMPLDEYVWASVSLYLGRWRGWVVGFTRRFWASPPPRASPCAAST